MNHYVRSESVLNIVISLKINVETVLEDLEFKNFLRLPTMVGDNF